MGSTTVEDFDFLSRLGAGSFGTVFKVRRKHDNLLYVIKTVRIAELTRKEKMEAVNEVQLLSAIDSEFIVRYYDSFITNNEELNIVMEFCNRGDLQALLVKAKEKNMQSLKEELTWNIGLQILLGLHDLHEQNVLHRDLKTANVFLQKDPGVSRFFAVKVGDLGVAKLLETSTAFAQTIVGTPYYLSPELCADQPYRDRSDLWALGVILYECCTLSRPFEARNQCALIMKIIQSQLEPPPSTHASVELSALIVWLLQKDWTQRPRVNDILCESFIQDLLQENGLRLPDSLIGAPTTNRLRGSNVDDVLYEADFAAAIGDKEEISQWQKQQPSRTATGQDSKQASPASMLIPFRGLIASSTPSNSGMLPTAAAVRGDRVRGPAHAKRQTSAKVLTRHQIKPAAVTARAQTKNGSDDARENNPSMSASEKDDTEALAVLTAALALSQAKFGDEEDATYRRHPRARLDDEQRDWKDDNGNGDGDGDGDEDDDDAEYLRNFKIENGLATPDATLASATAGPKSIALPKSSQLKVTEDHDDDDNEHYDDDFDAYEESFDAETPQEQQQQDQERDSILYTPRGQPNRPVGGDGSSRTAGKGHNPYPPHPPLESRLLVTPSWAIRDSPLSARGPSSARDDGGGGGGSSENGSEEKEAASSASVFVESKDSPGNNDDEGDDSQSTRLRQEEERILTLRSWIGDIKKKLHEQLGDRSLFKSLYDVVRENVETNTTFLTGLSETDSYLKEIHSRLNDHLHTTLEGACRVVLQLKTLLALESEIGVRVDDYVANSIPESPSHTRK